MVSVEATTKRALEAADIGDDRMVLTLLKDLGNASADVQKAVVTIVNHALESPSCIYYKDVSSTPWSVAELGALIYFLRLGGRFVKVAYGPNKVTHPRSFLCCREPIQPHTTPCSPVTEENLSCA